jgi:hypothetical protein
MADSKELELRKELETARSAYFDVYRKVVDLNLPGTIDLAAVKCNGGAVCGGGEWLVASDILLRALRQ